MKAEAIVAVVFFGACQSFLAEEARDRAESSPTVSIIYGAGFIETSDGPVTGTGSSGDLSAITSDKDMFHDQNAITWSATCGTIQNSDQPVATWIAPGTESTAVFSLLVRGIAYEDRNRTNPETARAGNSTNVVADLSAARTKNIEILKTSFTHSTDADERSAVALKIGRLYTQDPARLSPNYTEGIHWYEECLRALGDNMSERALDAKIEIATLYRRVGKSAEALRVLREVAYLDKDKFIQSMWTEKERVQITELTQWERIFGIAPDSEVHQQSLNERIAFREDGFRMIYERKALIATRALLWDIYRDKGVSEASEESKKLPDPKSAESVMNEILADQAKKEGH